MFAAGNFTTRFPDCCGQEFHQRLVHFGDVRKRSQQFFVPHLVIFDEVIRIHMLAAGTLVLPAERLRQVQVAVVIRQLIAGVDVSHGQFEIVSRREAIGPEAVIHELAVVPTENEFACVVAKAILAEDLLINVVVLHQLDTGEFAVELVERPGHGSLGNELRRKNAVADFVVNVTQFRRWVYHRFYSLHIVLLTEVVLRVASNMRSRFCTAHGWKTIQ